MCRTFVLHMYVTHVLHLYCVQCAFILNMHVLKHVIQIILVMYVKLVERV